MDCVSQTTTDYTAAQRAAILARSDENDRWQARLLAAWSEGYRSAETDHEHDYGKGHTAGWMAYKRAIHGTVDDVRQHCATWDGLRANFGQPRPGDYTGGPAGPVETRVWLAGPVVHHHGCTAACYAIEPGWYEPGAAADILATLPGDHAEAITRLRAAELARAA